MSKKLEEIIEVNSDFQRSVNIHEDMGSLLVIQGYVFTHSAEEVLLNVAKNHSHSSQSSYTWTGPYGSGKSSLALVLMTFLGRESKADKLLKKKMRAPVYNALGAAFPSDQPWLSIPVVGDRIKPELLLRRALKECGISGSGRKPVLKLVEEYIVDKKLIIVFDEMGKVLEHAAEGGADIYFFQQLAEMANRSRNLIFIGILHQSVSEYARGLPFSVRDEWSKIQGRFSDSVINAAGEEQIELISRAIIGDNKKYIDSGFLNLCTIVSKNIASNRSANSTALAKVFSKCWPLHPETTSLLSAFSKKKFGQNQRSVFSFLSSSERSGFIDFIRHTDVESSNLIYRPHAFFDYLHFNFESYITTSSDSKVWNLCLECIARIEASNQGEEAVQAVKTIALIDMFRTHSGLTATKQILCAALDLELEKIDEIVSFLEKNSIVIFKKHLNAYSLFEGSDFDIEAAVTTAISRLNHTNYVDKLTNLLTLAPVVAKKHYHDTGAIRWFGYFIVQGKTEAGELEEYSHNHIGDFVLCIPQSAEERRKAEESKGVEYKDCAFTVLQNHQLFNRYLEEIAALEWIQSNDNHLLGDAVARREVESRIYFLSKELKAGIDADLESAIWFVDGVEAPGIHYHRLSVFVSEQADLRFPSSPKIYSELLNRDKPSGSANMGSSALIKAMFTQQGEERLGIEGYPAEGGLYDVLIGANDLYNGKKLVRPSPESSLFPLWQATDKFLAKTNSNLNLKSIYEFWQKEFGVKGGLCPFLASAYILTNRACIACYLEKIYQVDLSDLFADFVIKTPQYIELRWVDDSIGNTTYLSSLLKVLVEVAPQVSDVKSKEVNSLYVARYLVKFADDLNKWILRTKRLSKVTIQFRECVKSSNDPNRLLYNELPRIFDSTTSKIKEWKSVFSDVLIELKEAYPKLLEEFLNHIADELSLNAVDPDALKKLSANANRLKGKSGDFRLNSFITRLSLIDLNDLSSIDSLISMSISKPINQWIDNDIDRAKLELSELIDGYRRVERLVLKKKGQAGTVSIFIDDPGSSTENKVLDIRITPKRDSQGDFNRLKQKLVTSLESFDGDKTLIASALMQLCVEHLNIS